MPRAKLIEEERKAKAAAERAAKAAAERAAKAAAERAAKAAAEREAKLTAAAKGMTGCQRGHRSGRSCRPSCSQL